MSKDRQCADSAQSSAGGTRLRSSGSINVPAAKSAPSASPAFNTSTGSSVSHKRGKQG